MSPLAFSDSLAALSAAPNECPSCHTVSHITRGLCLACLLRAGAEEMENLDGEEFGRALDGVPMPDTNWRIGKYEILEEIGRGGMGVIYRARQRHSRRVVALKRILSYHADSQETLKRFRREAEAAASLDHPNILPIYEVDESGDGVPFFSMKFASGGSLQDVGAALRDDPREIVRLLAKVARAVQYAHRQGILHRDLKPGNILLDGRGEPLVSDFGLAKWLDTSSDLTRTLTIFGTPGYIAPEQADGRAAAITPAADVYSLGAILFDLLTGRPPFFGEHALAVIRQAGEKNAPKLRSLGKGFDKDLETICARCLEREPTARYRSAGDLAEDLERWLEGRPIIARPVSPPITAWRWARRNTALAACVCGILLVSATAVVRQFHAHALTATLRQNSAQQHSLAVVPFLDLDSVTPDSDLATLVGTTLQTQMGNFGPARLVTLASPPRRWTGLGNLDQVRSAGEETHCRAIVTGTIRRMGAKQRLSLQVAAADGGDKLGCWDFEVAEKGGIAQALAQRNIAGRIYRALSGGELKEGGSATDPAMLDDVARSYLNAGISLLDHRNILDFNRAIESFESAIAAAPKSVMARAYLSIACVGRNYLRADPKIVQHGLEVSREAIALSPDDALAQRAFCAVQICLGQFHEALEHGFRSLERGDPSERAFSQIAYIWQRLGHPELALAWYEKAKISENQPDYYDALMGDCWLNLTEDEKAAGAFQAAEQFRPDWAYGWLGMCQLKVLQGDIAGARSLYQKSAVDFQSYPGTKRMGAEIEFFGRNFALAQDFYSQLLQENAKEDGAQQYGAICCRSALARIAFAKGDTKTGQALIQESIARDRAKLEQSTDNAEVLYRLAAEQAIAAQNDAALIDLRRAIQAGWIDYRSPRLDPRFDNLRKDIRFEEALSQIEKMVAAINPGRLPKAK